MYKNLKWDEGVLVSQNLVIGTRKIFRLPLKPMEKKASGKSMKKMLECIKWLILVIPHRELLTPQLVACAL